MPQEQRGARGSLSHGRKAPSRGEQPPVGGAGCQQGPFTQLLGIFALLCQRSRGFWGIHIVEEVLPPTLALLYSSHPPPSRTLGCKWDPVLGGDLLPGTHQYSHSRETIQGGEVWVLQAQATPFPRGSSSSLSHLPASYEERR